MKRKSSKRSPRHLFDVDHIKKHTPRYKTLKTKIKKMKTKGVGVFANKDIKKGEVIVYYLIKAYHIDEPPKKFKQVYTISLYSKKGVENNKLVGDLCDESLPPPDKNGIAYWGYLANEPSLGDTKNSFLSINTRENYKSRSRFKFGDYVKYKLIATKNIKKGDEITWCYTEDDNYSRNYETSCFT